MDASKEFVRALLTLKLPVTYPNDPPVMSLGATRGLGDADIADILRVLQDKAMERPGEPVLWELLEVWSEGRDHQPPVWDGIGILCCPV